MIDDGVVDVLEVAVVDDNVTEVASEASGILGAEAVPVESDGVTVGKDAIGEAVGVKNEVEAISESENKEAVSVGRLVLVDEAALGNRII